MTNFAFSTIFWPSLLTLVQRTESQSQSNPPPWPKYHWYVTQTITDYDLLAPSHTVQMCEHDLVLLVAAVALLTGNATYDTVSWFLGCKQSCKAGKCYRHEQNNEFLFC